MKVIFCTILLIVSNLYISYSQTKIGEFEGPVFDLIISSDGGTLAYTKENNIELWDIKNVKKLISLEEGHNKKVLSLDFSHVGDKIISGGRDEVSIVWNLAAPKSKQILSGQKGNITAVKFSPNDSLIATASSDNSIFIWNSSELDSPTSLRAHLNDVTDIEFINNKLLVSCDADGYIIIWDLDKKKEVKKWLGHKKWIRDITLDSTRTILASCGDDSKIKRWNISYLENIELISEKRIGYDWLMSLDYNKDNFLVSGGGNRNIYIDANNGSYAFNTISSIIKVLFVPNELPFKLVYGTINNGIYLLTAANLKYFAD